MNNQETVYHDNTYQKFLSLIKFFDIQWDKNIIENFIENNTAAMKEFSQHIQNLTQSIQTEPSKKHECAKKLQNEIEDFFQAKANVKISHTKIAQYIDELEEFPTTQVHTKQVLEIHTEELSNFKALEEEYIQAAVQEFYSSYQNDISILNTQTFITKCKQAKIDTDVLNKVCHNPRLLNKVLKIINIQNTERFETQYKQELELHSNQQEGASIIQLSSNPKKQNTTKKYSQEHQKDQSQPNPEISKMQASFFEIKEKFLTIKNILNNNISLYTDALKTTIYNIRLDIKDLQTCLGHLEGNEFEQYHTEIDQLKVECIKMDNFLDTSEEHIRKSEFNAQWFSSDQAQLEQIDREIEILIDKIEEYKALKNLLDTQIRFKEYDALEEQSRYNLELSRQELKRYEQEISKKLGSISHPSLHEAKDLSLENIKYCAYVTERPLAEESGPVSDEISSSNPNLSNSLCALESELEKTGTQQYDQTLQFFEDNDNQSTQASDDDNEFSIKYEYTPSQKNVSSSLSQDLTNSALESDLQTKENLDDFELINIKDIKSKSQSLSSKVFETILSLINLDHFTQHEESYSTDLVPQNTHDDTDKKVIGQHLSFWKFW